VQEEDVQQQEVSMNPLRRRQKAQHLNLDHFRSEKRNSYLPPTIMAASKANETPSDAQQDSQFDE
jgi:hypothetical protein